MRTLNPRDYELVAIGAAVASNCIPCIEYHIPEARKSGLSDEQIREAVQIAEKLKQVPAKKILDAAAALLTSEKAETGNAGCGCGSASAESADACCS